LEIAMTTPVRAALYLRVSTGRQADNDLSIPDQRRQAKAYCASRRWEIVADYVELSRKVKKLKRQRTRSLIHGPDSGSADRPAHSWGDQWRRHSGTTVDRAPKAQS
jgi:hypothetical protein